MSKGKRWFFRIFAAIILVPTAALLCLYVSCWVNQKRAEKLFQRVSELRVGESTFDEVQALWKQYGSRNPNPDEMCDQSDCTFHVQTENFVSEHKLDWKFLRAIGIKPAIESSTLQTSNGKLSYSGFELLYETEAGDWVYAFVDSRESFSTDFLCHNLPLQQHPTFVASGGYRSEFRLGVQITVSLTPGAPESAREIARGINWKCMTAVLACEGFSSDASKGLEAVMPAAFAQSMRDQEWENHQNLGDYPQLIKDCQFETYNPLPTKK